MKTVAFVPIKLNSERLPLKNIKPFCDGTPLISCILKTLNKVKNVDEVYVYCSDEKITEYLPEGVKFLKRDPYYDLSTTKFNEVLSSFAELVEADVYVLTHATAPFISAESIELGVEKVASGEYESAHAVTLLQEFLWHDGKPLNYELQNIPRTQDLPKYFTETCGLYVYTRDLILNQQRRISDKPYLVEVTKIEACDINTGDDFIIADAIYASIYGGENK
ncbi:MAG: acylneuraminate cytidylyltransferase family protein [Ruminiclostridium sp.]|nr:acylneuraminate cytidylyltransferase family protein [Ruminiclostridium sp.]MBQ8842855.1 acylneuraminate cytidylyltransferase family protein [Ruminiclostridium sp.]